jgi:hypothetical protein|tara:strand:+ start:2301 stop:2609 length:309 start_codon:yes stop_codon:yes gene_type:complete
MTIIEYILDPQDKPRSFYPKTIPDFVSDGGYFMSPDGSEKLIGVGVEGKIPDNTETFNLQQLQERQVAIHAQYPMREKEPDGDVLTNEEVNAVVEDWWDTRS